MMSDLDDVGMGSETPVTVRERRLRRRNSLRRPSEDVIIIESPHHASSSHAPRRRRIAPRHLDESIVDLTCSTQDDNDVVDLTSPDIPPSPAIEIFSETFGNETESDHNTTVESPTTPLIKCPICLESMARITRKGDQIMSTNCGHIFCSRCIKQSIEHTKKCPTCRRKLTMRNIHPLYLPV